MGVGWARMVVSATGGFFENIKVVAPMISALLANSLFRVFIISGFLFRCVSYSNYINV